MLIAYRDIADFVPVKISGVVKDLFTDQPVSGVHVFHVKGEDESFTNEKGEFVISTWQQLPVMITTEHQFFKSTTVIISDIQTGIVISLKTK